MTDHKVSGGAPPVSYPPAPPPYTTGETAQGGTYQPAPGYSQQSNVFVQPAGPQPGSTFRYREGPALIVCQHCNATVTTSVTYQTGTLTWIASGIICLVGAGIGCCLIPFCLDSCKDCVHTCPSCKMVNGHYRRMES